MAADYNEIVRIIQQIVRETVERQQPMSAVLATVISEDPVKVETEKKLVLEPPILVIPQEFTDHKAKMEIINNEYAIVGGDGVRYLKEGEREYKRLNALKVGDRVLVIRAEGGQRFIIMGRIPNS